MRSTLGRRGFLLGCVGLTAAACATGPREPGNRGTGPTRTVETDKGAVEVPANPRRVVCLDQYSTLAMLDVGARPVATIDGLDEWLPERYLRTYRELPRVGGYQADPERILRMRPDVIIGNSAFTLGDGSSYEQLSAIAPTVILPAVTAGEWTTMALRVGEVINRDADMKRLRERYLERAHEIKGRYRDELANRRFSLVAAFENGQWNLCFPDSWSGVVLAEAGCRFASASAGKTGTSQERSFEQLGTLSDSDVIFYQVNPSGRTDAPMRAVLDQPGFQRLPAVRAGRAIAMRNLYVFSYIQALGTLDELEAALDRLR